MPQPHTQQERKRKQKTKATKGPHLMTMHTCTPGSCDCGERTESVDQRANSRMCTSGSTHSEEFVYTCDDCLRSEIARFVERANNNDEAIAAFDEGYIGDGVLHMLAYTQAAERHRTSKGRQKSRALRALESYRAGMITFLPLLQAP